MRPILLACCLMACSGLTGSAQKQTPDEIKLQELQEQIQAIERARAALVAFEKSAELMAATYNYQCMSAVGHAPFCDCLSKNTPIKINFSGYIEIVTTNKSETDYDKLSKEDQGVYDATVKARDVCVATAFPNR